MHKLCWFTRHQDHFKEEQDRHGTCPNIYGCSVVVASQMEHITELKDGVVPTIVLGENRNY